jgi:glycerophosphoryl diester phosphodiesterase
MGCVFLFMGLFILMVLVYCIAPGKLTPPAKKMAEAFYGLNCAHRGLHTKDQRIPENSLPAFKLAREMGYGVELDVHLSKDERVVVFHDDDLKCACGVDKPVSGLTWDELNALRLFETNERIPLLTEVLAVLGDTPVIAEIKSAGSNNAKLCEKTLEILSAYGGGWCIESFDPRAAAWFRKNAPDVLRGQLSTPPHKFDTITKWKAFLLGNLLTNFISRPHFIAYSTEPRPLTVKLCRMMNPMTAIWTVRPNSDIARCEKENDTIIFEYYTPSARYK